MRQDSMHLIEKVVTVAHGELMAIYEKINKYHHFLLIYNGENLNEKILWL